MFHFDVRSGFPIFPDADDDVLFESDGSSSSSEVSNQSTCSVLKELGHVIEFKYFEWFQAYTRTLLVDLDFKMGLLLAVFSHVLGLLGDFF